jgi:isopentenyl phosphate kinase
MALIFLKLGGSLITDKSRPYTARLDKIEELASQIARTLQRDPSIRLVLGHGSGSFGHQAASSYGTRQGVQNPEEWRGFAEVWYQASALNRLVVDALHKNGLPVINLSPAASVTARDGIVSAWDTSRLLFALNNGLLPVIHGDVIFDEVRGGTILSTEDLFAHLAPLLKPQRILLAGLEEGIWADFPQRTQLIKSITFHNVAELTGLGNSATTDVTGGMKAKVAEMMPLVERIPGLEVLIFSGEASGTLAEALEGENPGTLLHR